MEASKQFLATQVLNEGKVVTYRTLSRALKVHVNKSKELLEQFHKSENGKKPKSVHATYLITGIRKPEIEAADQPVLQQQPNGSEHTNGGANHDDGDVEMQLDEPAPPSSVPSFLLSPSDQQPPESTPEVLEEDDIQTTTILLVKEESLEEAKNDFESVLRVEIYSLEPSSPKDVHQLTVANEVMYTTRLAEDRKEASQTYGIIWNESVKTRKLESGTSTTGGNPVPASTVSVPGLKKEDSKTGFGAAKAKTIGGNSGSGGGGALMSSFAKSKPPKPKEVKKEEPKDETMKDVFDEDGDSDDEEPVAPKKQDLAAAEAARKARQERQEALRAMMDDESDSALETAAAESQHNKPAQKKARVVSDDEDEDEDMDDAPDSPIEDETAATALDTKSALPQDVKTEEETSKPSGDGRRRGRRRVIKKKHYQDEKGYFVSKEVEEWESFSEADDEPKPSKTSAPVKQLPKAGAGAPKKGTPGGAKKEGNIMSFFGKKP